MSDIETSLEDDLKAAMAEIEAREPEAAEPEPAADPVEPDEDKGPARGPDGKFAKKEGDEPTDTTADAPAADVSTEATAENDKPVQPDPFGLAPHRYPDEIKEKWGSLTDEWREFLTKREAEFHKFATRYDEERVVGKRAKEVIAPFEGFIKSLGAEPMQAVDYLLKTDYALRTAPPEQRREMFIKAAKDYGVDLSLPGMDSSSGQPSAHDPAIETLQQRINRLEAERNADMLRARETEQQGILSQIEAFRADPAHPYFDRVHPVMIALLENGTADNLDKAYEMAVYADPETRALQLAAHEADRERKRQAEAAAHAEKARAASVSVTGAPGLTPATPAPESSGSIEDDLRNAIRAVSGRA